MNVVAISATARSAPPGPVPLGAARQETRLWRSPAALAAVRAWGLSDATIRRFHLGIKEPYVARATGLVTDHALSFPIIGTEGWIANRFAYLNVDGVTSNPGHPVGWGPGSPVTMFSRRPFGAASLVVVDSVVRMWLFAQLLDQPGSPVVIACRSHTGGMPLEWRSEHFWAEWSKITLALEGTAGEEELARVIAARSAAPLHALPAEAVTSIFDPMGGVSSAAEVRALISDASAWTPRPMIAADAIEFTPLAGAPLVLDGAYLRGRMYHPVTMERTSPAGDGDGTVSSYVVRVLRSDGALLDAATLPHPPGTPAADRVVALSDGTRIMQLPRPSAYGSWSYHSVSAFVAARAEGREPVRRALAAIVDDIERHLRAAVWLPDPDAFVVAALFVVAGYVHRVFDALPILMLNGPAGSGKSELGAAIAALGLNGMVVGQVSGAGLIRLIDEVRGVLVIDDLEAIAGSSAAAVSEVSQVLKCSYKQSTARKAIPGRGGRVRMYDFYCPKVVSNIGGCGDVLASRMLSIRTAPMNARLEAPDPPHASAADLRDEMHVWAMCEAADVDHAYRSPAIAGSGRLDEIAAPLRAIAVLSGDPRLRERLERWLAVPAITPPAPGARPAPSALLAQALRAAAQRGAVASISLAQVQLELALLRSDEDAIGDAPSAETVGRLLLSMGARRPDVAVERRRLHGMITRIYALSGANGVEAPGSELAFCSDTPCGSCPYVGVCERAVPGLRTAKLSRARPA